MGKNYKPVEVDKRIVKLDSFMPVFDEVIARMCEGEGVRNILKDLRNEGFEHANFYMFFKMLREHDKLAELYAHATDIRADIFFEKMIDTAETTEIGEVITDSDEKGRTIVTKDMTEHRRLKVDTYKFVVARLAPKKYGDKQSVEQTVHIEQPLFPDMHADDSELVEELPAYDDNEYADFEDIPDED